MNKRQFTLWNWIAASAVFVISLLTYTLTLEPTASFWDCGEFIASSFKLEVGHPPGNPVFQLIARFFSMFTGAENAAVAINWMSGQCSAFTIFFLYLTIVFFAKRLFKAGEDGIYSKGNAIAIIGSGVVGALAYTFSDTFWFSAVEAEVYAMSSLFTAIVFWAMTRWYDQADEPHADRWIVLVFLLMGLSIGVHLLNLLAIPALVFLYAYRKRGDKEFNFGQLLGILAISVVILGFLVFFFIPKVPVIAAGFDRFFVNSLGLPYNSGAAFFVVSLLAAGFIILFIAQRKGHYLTSLITLCFTTLVIGFSLFSVVIIRSSVKTPTNEYQPDNPYTLVRYLSREQYGSAPLVYGAYFGAELDREDPYVDGEYYAPLNGRYESVPSPTEPNYDDKDKMLFPRMWSPYAGGPEYYVEHYMPGSKYTDADGYEHYTKPTMGENLGFFIDYQLNWMYWRYFFWNFAGRQNDIHGQQPNDLYGNWESGIGPLDRAMLGDQSALPDDLKNNPGKNHYYMLPLLLGLFGLFFQFARDRRGSWLVFLMFFMTGIAIVLYLNQPPMQVRERDYAYAGSFYFYAAWIGLGVAALYSWLSGLVKEKGKPVLAVGVSFLCLGVPVLMAAENWDDHDRSHRYTAVEMARNYLNSVGTDGYLVTHGDNDTFPLWYAQEVEGVRPDVRIFNTSLLGTDWHIDQMLWAVNDAAPVPLSIPHEQYLYGTNEAVYIGPAFKDRIYDAKGNKVRFEETLPVAEAVAAFVKQNNYRVATAMDEWGKPSSFQELPVFPCRSIIIPVNRENAVRSGILDPKLVDEWLGDGDGTMTSDELALVPDSITMKLPSNVLHKPALFLVDLLANYQWDRPLHMLPYGSDFNVGQDDYMMYVGYTSILSPLSKKEKRRWTYSDGEVGSENYEVTRAYADMLYDRVDSVFTWEALRRENYYVDYQHRYTFLASSSQRYLFYRTALALLQSEQPEKAVAVLDKCFRSVPESQYPYETIATDFSTNDQVVSNLIDLYYRAAHLTEDPVKAREIALKGDVWAEAYARELLANAPSTQAGTSLYDRQADYADEFFYLLYNVQRSGDLRPVPEWMADLEKGFDRFLASYDPYPTGGTLMAEAFIKLRRQRGQDAVDSAFVKRWADPYARVLAKDPALNLTLLNTQFAYAEQLVPNPTYLNNPAPLSSEVEDMLTASFRQKLLECQVTTAEDLETYLDIVYDLFDYGWIDDVAAHAALRNQLSLIGASRGNGLEDLYEQYSIAMILQDVLTERDIQRYASAVYSQCKASRQGIRQMDLLPTEQDQYENYFNRFVTGFRDMGFLSERQAQSLLFTSYGNYN